MMGKIGIPVLLQSNFNNLTKLIRIAFKQNRVVQRGLKNIIIPTLNYHITPIDTLSNLKK